MRPPLLLFSAATLFLLGSVVAVILGQLEANALTKLANELGGIVSLDDAVGDLAESA